VCGLGGIFVSARSDRAFQKPSSPVPGSPCEDDHARRYYPDGKDEDEPLDVRDAEEVDEPAKVPGNDEPAGRKPVRSPIVEATSMKTAGARTAKTKRNLKPSRRYWPAQSFSVRLFQSTSNS
jgi:hypothetical protein